MTHATNPRCEICRYWSARNVRQVDFRHGGRIEAACLCSASPNAGQFVTSEATCGHCLPSVTPVDAIGGDWRAAA